MAVWYQANFSNMYIGRITVFVQQYVGCEPPALIRRSCAGAESGGGGPPRLQVPVCPADTQMDNTPLLSFQGRYVRYSNAALGIHI